MEREADRVAHAVMSDSQAAAFSPSTLHQAVQRCACGGSATEPCEKCRGQGKPDEGKAGLLQRASGTSQLGGTTAPGIVAQVLAESGEPLEAGARTFLEPRFGFSLANIRVHHDAKAAASASSVMARAYATGNHIVFNRGEYTPQSPAGRRLIAHEIAHVVQQGAASSEQVVQRQAFGVHESTFAAAPPAGVPAEKWSENAEAAYRKAGQIEAADAVRRCRGGDCKKILLTSETHTALLLGRHAAKLPLDSSGLPAAHTASGSVSRSVSGIVQRLVSGAAEAASEAALRQAVARFGAASAVESEVGVAAVALPAALLGAVIIVSIIALSSEAALQEALRAQGFVILPDILGVCISNCHQPDARRSREEWHLHEELMPDPRQFLRDPGMPQQPGGSQSYQMEPVPTPAPQPSPAPEPRGKPKSKDKEKRKDCSMTPRRTSRGDDPLANLFCEHASGGAPSVDIWSTVGSGEIDALRGNTWFECKCGYLSSVRAFKKGVPWAKAAMMGGKKDNGKLGLFEQIQRQMRIADHCGLDYRVVVASEEVARFFREQFPSLKVDVQSFEPCEG